MSFLKFRWVTFPEWPAAVPPCGSESVKACVPLCVEKAWLQIWRVLDATAEHPGRHCVALTSAGDSAGQGLLMNSARHRARQSRIHEAFCRSYNASLLRSRCSDRK